MDAALRYNSDNNTDNNIADNDAFIKHPDPERFLVELGYSRSPLEILALLRKETSTRKTTRRRKNRIGL
jgi:hypothetical protein